MASRGPSGSGGKAPDEPNFDDEQWDAADTVMSTDRMIDDLIAPEPPEPDPEDAPGMDATLLGAGVNLDDLQPRAKAGTPARASAAVVPKKPRGLAATDTAPLFRPDLKIVRGNTGYSVRDPATNIVVPLNEFEVSLVRMLNGRRPVSEILDSSHRLGIPINLESLQAFITKLEEAGFIAGSTHAPNPGQFPTRGQWETSIRNLFQTGIRLLRSGKPDEAASYFEALLAQDPDNEEARELLAMANNAANEPGWAMGSAHHPQLQTGSVAPVPQRDYPSQPPPYQRDYPSHPPPYQQQPYPPRDYPSQPPPGYPPLPMPGPLPQRPMEQQPAAATPTSKTSIGRQWWIVALAAVVLAGIGVVAFVVLNGNSNAPNPAGGSNGSNGSSGSAIAVVPDASAGSAAKTVVIDAAPPDAAPADAAVADATEPDADTTPATTPDAGSGDGSATGPTAVVAAPTSGEVTKSYLDKARNVTKGEKLFEITHVSHNADRERVLRAKIAELERLAAQDNGGAFVPAAAVEATSELPKVRAELKNLTKIQKIVVEATRSGHAEPRISRGVTVKQGTVLAEITTK